LIQKNYYFRFLIPLKRYSQNNYFKKIMSKFDGIASETRNNRDIEMVEQGKKDSS